MKIAPFKLMVASAVLAAMATGCRKTEPAPPHVVQQQERRSKEQEELAALKRAAGKGDAGAAAAAAKKMDELEASWPAELREAFYALLDARFADMMGAARGVAMLGPVAAPALEQLLTMKRQPVKKRALVAMLLAEMNMFRTAELARFLKEREKPYLQRAALEGLGRIRNAEAVAALEEMKKVLETAGPPPAAERTIEGGEHDGHDHSPAGADEKEGGEGPAGERALQPLVEFVDAALQRPGSWGYSAGQLVMLDRVMHAPTPAELAVALEWIKDLTLADGLLAMVGSPATRPAVARAVAGKVLGLATGSPGKLRELTAPGLPEPIRLMAARALLESGDAGHVRFLRELARRSEDPVALFLRQALEQVGEGGK